MLAHPAARLGRYRLLEPLGTGGMATVWRAVIDGPKGFSRELAIKRVLREYAADPDFIEMLAQEARLSALLRHPNIVQVYEFGQLEDEHYLAMELVEGFDLRSILMTCAKRGRRLPPGVACYLVGELAAALGYAHALTDPTGRRLDIVHRDVSPSNVMVTRFGAVKLLDFGVAKAADRLKNEQTRTGLLKGKIGYLSPEQADGAALDGRSDIFALGIVLHECLTSRRLFRGASELQTLSLIRDSDAAPPSDTVVDLDPEIDAVVGKMLARDPAARFASCEEVVARLAPLARRLGGDASELRRVVDELGLSAQAGVATPAGSAATVPAIPRSARRKLRRAGAALFVSVSLVGLGATAGLVHHRHPAAVVQAAPAPASPARDLPAPTASPPTTAAPPPASPPPIVAPPSPAPVEPKQSSTRKPPRRSARNRDAATSTQPSSRLFKDPFAK